MKTGSPIIKQKTVQMQIKIIFLARVKISTKHLPWYPCTAPSVVSDGSVAIWSLIPPPELLVRVRVIPEVPGSSASSTELNLKYI